MFITFLAIITPLLLLIRPLQRNIFFVIYFAIMVLSAYITENYYFRATEFSHQAFLIFVVYHLVCINAVTFLAYGIDKRAAVNGLIAIYHAKYAVVNRLVGAFCV